MMNTHPYQIAQEHATNEVGEITAQIEMLTQRKVRIEKLVELLKDLVPGASEANGAAVVALEHQHEGATQEAPAEAAMQG
jgi:hypothetical protein